jgi:septation ring formation regulator EzrA
MKRSHKYATIDSLSKLREERYKLQSEIANRELMLSLNYSELKESLSITRFLTNLITKISVIMPMFQMAKRLYRSVIDIFSREEEETEEVKESDIKT